ncbi:MAG TPA: GNAT family N-acetyltransferase [Thermoanaerobaculia bacterium]
MADDRKVSTIGKTAHPEEPGKLTVSSAVVVRKAEHRDAQALGRLGVMLMRTHYAFDRERFLAPRDGAESGYAAFLSSRLDSADDCVFVAERDGAIVGYVYAALEPLSWKELRGPAGFIHDVVVAEEARRAGTGTQLMQTAIGWLREHGAPRVILWTAAPNDAAQRLFRRLGFRDTMIEMTMELEEK